MKSDLKISYPCSEKVYVNGTMCGPNFCAMKISHTICDE